MRAIFSLLGLVIVAAIVAMVAKQQLGSLKGAPSASVPVDAASSVPAGGPIRPQAVGQQVQSTLDEAARRTAEAAASVAGN